MKKSIQYIALAAAGALMALSCNKNQPPVFDDANAFVAFPKETTAGAEGKLQEDGSYLDGDIVRLPVTLASVEGIEEAVKFNVIDGTAKSGVNYRVLTAGGTLSFDAENRTRYIEIQLLYDGIYTGDLKFTVNLEKPQTVNLGSAKTCTVTVQDVDHPLAALLGSYTVTAAQAYNNPWKMTLYKDEKDDHKVWFFNLTSMSTGWAGFDTMYYGNVDDELSKIIVPFGQKTEYEYGTSGGFILFGMDGDVNSDETQIYDSGNIELTINKNAAGKVVSIDFGTTWGLISYIPNLGQIGWVNPFGCVAVKD